MTFIEYFNSFGAFSSMVGMCVSLYSLFFVKGIDARLSRLREEQRYGEHWGEVKQLTRRVDILCGVFARQRVSQGLSRAALGQLAQEMEGCVARLRTIQCGLEGEGELCEALDAIMALELSVEGLMGRRGEAGCVVRLKGLLVQVDEAFAAAVHRADESVSGGAR